MGEVSTRWNALRGDPVEQDHLKHRNGAIAAINSGTLQGEALAQACMDMSADQYILDQTPPASMKLPYIDSPADRPAHHQAQVTCRKALRPGH